jgi:LPXTG-motif cell wall-anchored protein
MFSPLRLATAAICLALVMPAAAVADSAGDNQYQDPLANSPKPSHQKQKTTQTTTPAPVATPAPAATSSAPAQSSSASATSSGTLPRTGFPVAPLVVLGAALIGAGLIVRRLT